MNIVSLCGRFGRDPEIRYTQSGMAIAKFTLAVDRRAGKDKERATDWISCVAFGKQAEVISQHFTKGMKIVLSGSIHTDSYERNGQ